MLKIYIISAFLILSMSSWAQTYLIDPSGDGGFETGSGFALNGWTGVSGANGSWYINTTTITNGSYSFVPSGTRSIYFSNNSGTNWRYNTSPISGCSHFYRDIAFPTGASNINLSFRWNASGENTWDIIYVYLCQTTLTPVANSPSSSSSTVTWTGTGSATLIGSYNLLAAGSGTTSNIVIPGTYAGTSARLVFSWKSDNSGGTEPPMAIDDIALSYVSGCSAPSSQATNFSNSNITSNSMTIGWTRGNGNNVLVVAHSGSAVNSSPVSGTTYTANAAYGSGTQIGTGNYVVYNGTGTSVDVTLLSQSTPYYFAAYEYNTTGSCYNTTALTGTASTPGPPVISAHPSSVSVATAASTTFSVTASGTAITYQWQVNTGAGWTNITAAGSSPTYANWTTASLNVNSVVSGNNGYQYRCVVSGSYAPVATSNAATLNINVTYCTPIYTSTGTTDYINNFSTTNGSTNITNNNSGSNGQANKYIYYSTQTVTANAGSSFNFSIQSGGSYAEGFRIWIDYNGDGDFADAGEDVWNSGTLSTAVRTGSITIPAGATQGLKRMRIRCNDVVVPASGDYCTSFTFGETEDYNVQVVVPCTPPTMQATNFSANALDCSTLKLNWLRGNGTKVLVLAKQGSAVNASPVYGTSYTANATFGSGTQIGSGNYVVYDGTGSNVILTNLSFATYYFEVIEYTSSTFCYKTSALTGSGAPLTTPSILTNPSNSIICAGTNTQFTVNAAGSYLEYQWQAYNGSAWSDITATGTNPTYANWTDDTLLVNSAVAGNNAFQYRCVITGICGSAITSNTATLYVNTAGPTISVHPANVTACSNATATFTVTASGGTLSYQWQEYISSWNNITTGGSYTGATSASLSISSPSGMSGRQYRCIVNSVCSTVTSNAATLTVNLATTQTANPASVSLCAGSNTTFTATASGTSVAYQWQVSTDGGTNYANIAAAGTAPVYANWAANTLTLTGVTAANNNYKYRCVATGTCGAVTSGIATLIVNSVAPTISAHPASVTVCSNVNATFSVTATGGTFTYQWQEYVSVWTNITDGGSYSGATTATLTLTSPLALSGHQYRCNLNYICATMSSNPATLGVNQVTTLTTAPANSAVCLGANTSFNVAATGTSLSYQWQVSINGGTSFTNITAAGTVPVYANWTTNTLSLTGVDATNNNYLYKCIITGTCGAVTAGNATLTVNPAPVISNPANTTVCTGTPQTLTLTATGAGLSYQWQEYISSWSNVADGGIYSGATTAAMTLSDVSALNARQYRCILATSCSVARDTSTAAVLTVGVTPTITATVPATRCGSGVVSLSATANTGTVNWYAASTGGTSLATGTSYTTVSLSSTTTYYAGATNGTCLSTSRTAVAATVKVVPTVLSVVNGFICSSGTVALSATPSSGTITWYDAASAGNTLATGNSFTTPALSASTSYYVDATLNGCSTTSRSVVNAFVNVAPIITSIPAITLYKDKGKQITVNGNNLFAATFVLGGITGTVSSNNNTQAVISFPAGNYTDNTLSLTTTCGTVSDNTSVTVTERDIIPVNGGTDYHTTILSALNGLYSWMGATAFPSSKTIDIYSTITYTEAINPNPNLNPTSSNKLIIQGHAGTSPVINASGLTNGIKINNIDNVVVTGFTVSSATGDNIYVIGSNCEISYNRSLSSSASGIRLENSTGSLSQMHHNLCYSNNTYGIYNVNSPNTVIANNTCYGNGIPAAASWTDNFETNKGWSFSGTATRGAVTNPCGSACSTPTPRSGSNLLNLPQCSSNASSYASITLTLASAGTFSGYYQIGAEAGYDFFTWSIDAVPSRTTNQVSSGACVATWTAFSFAVPAGTHTIYLGFSTDVSTNSNGSRTLIDDVQCTNVGSGTGSTGIGLYVQSGIGVEVKNNVLVSYAGSTSTIYAMKTNVAISATSGYNTFYANGNTNIINHNAVNYTDIAAWNATAEGNNDLSNDPLFVTPGTDFHEKSTAGTYYGGAWPPSVANNGTWTISNAVSSCLDSGDPTGDFASEPADNGSRINQGCYGGTPQASKTCPAPLITAYATPLTVYKDRGKQVVVNGSGLYPTTVTFGGIACTLNSFTGTTATITIPPGNYSNNTLIVNTPAGSVSDNTSITVVTRNTIPVKSSLATEDDHATISSALAGLWAWMGNETFDATKIINVYDGSYSGTSASYDLNPTLNNRLVLQAASGRPLIDATGSAYGINICDGSTSVDYITIKGFEIVNAQLDGIRLNSAYDSIYNNIIHDCLSSDIYQKGGNNGIIAYNKCYNTLGGSVQSCIKVSGSDYVNIHHNLCYNSKTYGIYLDNAVSDNCIVKNNTCYNNGAITSVAGGAGTLQPTSGTISVSVPDNACPTLTENSLTVSGGGSGVITDINVKVNITHSYVADLNLYLKHPDGTTVTLCVKRSSSPGANYTNTWFDDSGANGAITSGTAPYSGYFIPATSLSALNGKTIDGLWKLQMCDGAGTDVGTLTQWELNITYSLPAAQNSLGANLYIAAGANNEVSNNVFFAKKSTGDTYYALNTAAGVNLKSTSGYNTYFKNGNTNFVKHSGTLYNDSATWNATIYGNLDYISNPQFVDTNAYSVDFHEKSKSNAATYTGGNWPPLTSTGGTWTAYAGFYSSAIDAGNPADAYVEEQSYNGGRINQGCYGGTVQATRSCQVTIANAGADQSPACANPSITLAANNPTYGIGTWSTVSGAVSFANNQVYNTFITGVGAGTNTLRWTIANNGCSTFDDVLINNQMPSASMAGPDQILNAGTSSVLAANTPALGTGTWTVLTGSASFSNMNSPTSSITGLTEGQNVLVWSIANSSCPTQSDQVEILVLPSHTGLRVLNNFTNNGTFDQTNDPNCMMMNGSNGQINGASGTYSNAKLDISPVGLGTPKITFNGNVNNAMMKTKVKRNQLAIASSKIFKTDSLLVNNAATLVLNTLSTLECSGNFVNNGSVSYGDNTPVIKFNGLGNTQMLYSNSAASNELKNVIFDNKDAGNNAGSINLNDDVYVGASAQFTNGIVKTTSNYKLIFKDNSTAIGYNNSSFVDCQIQKLGDDNFIFPIGDAIGVNKVCGPLALDNSAGNVSDYYIADFHFENTSTALAISNTTNLGAGLHHTSSKEYWMLSKSAGAAYKDVVLYSNNMSRSGIANTPDIATAHWSGSTWDKMGSNAWVSDGANAGHITASGFTSYSPLTFASKTGLNPLGQADTLPQAYAGNDTTICSGTSINLTAVNSAGIFLPLSYSWNNGLGAGATQSVTPTVNTTYIVTVTDAHGNIDKDTVVVNVTTLPVITNTSPASRCDEGSVTLGATASAGSVNWYDLSSGGSSLSSGNSFSTGSVAVTTTYFVDATNNGCTTATRTAVVATVNATPIISGTTPASRCDAGTVTLSATASIGTINWYDSAIGGISLGSSLSYTTPNISSTTTYYVAAINGNCVTIVRTPVVATVNNSPVIATINPSSRCGAGILTLGATSSTGILNWYATSAGVTVLGSGTSFTTNSISSTTTFFVEASSNGCTSAISAVVATVNQHPVANAGTNQSINYSQTATLSGSATGGSGTYQYQWTPADSLVNAGIQSTATVSLHQSTTFTLLVTDVVSGCQGIDQVVVNINGGPLSASVSSNAPINTICAGHSVLLSTLPSGGTGNYTYSWTSVPVGFVSTQQNATVSPLVSTLYYVTVYDGINNVATSLQINVNPKYQTNVTATVCQGENYIFNGHSHNSSGLFKDTLQSISGCDSIITTSLTVLQNSIVNYQTSICGDQTYSVGSHIYTSSGIYYDTLPKSNGCDSIIVTALTVNPVYSSSNNVFVCEGQNYLFNGHYYSTAGTYRDTLQTILGCDSIIVTTLNVKPIYYHNVFDTICEGESYTLPNGSQVISSGTYTSNLTSSLVCDSTIVTNLTVNPSYSASVSVSICEGESYALPDGTMAFISGNFVSHLQTSLGCDSIIYTQLSVHQVFSSTQNVAVCNGGSYSVNGHLYYVAGTYHDTLSSVSACDSIVVTYLTVLQSSSVNLQSSICSGDSIFLQGDFRTTGGTYYDTLQTVSGCDSIVTTILTVIPNTLNVSMVTENITCYGASNGQITATVTGGLPTYIYSWNNGGNTQVISGLHAGSFVLTVVDANGCRATSAANITEPALLQSSTTVIAAQGGNNGAINMNISGGVSPYGIHWSNGATSEDLTGLAVGTYTVTITDANGCTLAKSVTVTGTSCDISIQLTTVNIDCYGNANGHITANVIGGTNPYSFVWSSGQTTNSISSLIAGEYVLTVTDFNSCSAVASTQILEPVALVSSVTGSDTLCYGSTNGLVNLTVSGGTPYYSYQWTNGIMILNVTTQDLYQVSSGNYSVTITDANGCVIHNSFFIGAYGQIQTGAIAGNAAVNNGSVENYSLTTTSGLNYSWHVQGGTISAGLGTDSIEVQWGAAGIGRIKLVVSNSNGCNGDTVYLNVVIGAAQPCSTLSVTTNGQDALCFGANSGVANAEATGGNPPYYYHWNDAYTQETATAFNLTANNYSVTVSDAQGCNVVGSFVVSQPVEIAINSIVSQASCGVANGSADVTAIGGTAPYSYLWSQGDTLASISGKGSGIYIVYVTDSHNCEEHAAVVIGSTGGPQISVTSVTNIGCNGGSSGAIDISVTGGTPPYTFDWSNSASTEDISGIAAGPYEVVVSDTSGCEAVNSIQITEPQALHVSVNVSNASCGNADGSLSALVSGGTTPYTYAWSSGNTNSSFNHAPVGSYLITVTDHLGCTTYGSGGVSEAGAATITIDSIKHTTCSADMGAIQISVNGVGNATYAWSNGATTQDVTGLAAGLYTVTVTAGGCSAVSQVTVNTIPLSLQNICVVTVDTSLTSIQKKNMLVWEKVQTSNISHYKIYKESTQAGLYYNVVTIPYDNMSTWVDMNSNPKVRAWRYKISAVDSCGNESMLGQVHKTIHLVISVGQQNSMNLIWNHYEGFAYYTYYIYRYLPATGWDILDSIPGDLNTYTDLNPGSGNVRYAISIEKLDACWASSSAKSMGGPYSQSLSNIEDNGIFEPVGVMPNVADLMSVNLFPNPTKGYLTIETGNKNKQTYEVFNPLGDIIMSGQFESTKTLNVNHLTPGVYFIRIVNGKFTVTKRFVKK